MLNDAASMEGEFSELDQDIVLAVSVGLRNYQKYYDCMDAQDAYYIGLQSSTFGEGTWRINRCDRY
jgi:hypothetical protein